MRWILGLATWLALAGVPPAVAGLCGSPDDYLAKLATVAIAAHIFCEDVNEISDTDSGRMLLAAGIDKRTLDGAACTREMVLAQLGLKAEYERDRGGWCVSARKLLSEHPLTKPLVRSAQPPPLACNEIDKGAALVAAGEKHCGYRATMAGRVIVDIGTKNAACNRQRAAEIKAAIATLALKMSGDMKRAERVWCLRTLADLNAQLSRMEMPPWLTK